MDDLQFERLKKYLIVKFGSKSFIYAYLLALHQYNIISDKQYVDFSSEVTLTKDLKD